MSRKSFDISEAITEVYNRDNWTCQKCGGRGTEIAHRIAQTKVNLKKYSAEIVHSKINTVTSCTNCNSSFNVGFNPLVTQIIIKAVASGICDDMNGKEITGYLENKINE